MCAHRTRCRAAHVMENLCSVMMMSAVMYRRLPPSPQPVLLRRLRLDMAHQHTLIRGRCRPTAPCGGLCAPVARAWSSHSRRWVWGKSLRASVMAGTVGKQFARHSGSTCPRLCGLSTMKCKRLQTTTKRAPRRCRSLAPSENTHVARVIMHHCDELWNVGGNFCPKAMPLR